MISKGTRLDEDHEITSRIYSPEQLVFVDQNQSTGDRLVWDIRSDLLCLNSDRCCCGVPVCCPCTKARISEHLYLGFPGRGALLLLARSCVELHGHIPWVQYTDTCNCLLTPCLEATRSLVFDSEGAILLHKNCCSESEIRVRWGEISGLQLIDAVPCWVPGGIMTDSPLTPITIVSSERGLGENQNTISPGCGCPGCETEVGKIEEIYKVMQATQKERGDQDPELLFPRASAWRQHPVTRQPVAVKGCSLNIYHYDPVTCREGRGDAVSPAVPYPGAPTTYLSAMLETVAEKHWSLNMYACCRTLMGMEGYLCGKSAGGAPNLY